MGLAFEGKEYGEDCSICFEEGYTPLYMMASFEGIKPTAWSPPAPPYPPYPDPNITIKLQQTYMPCYWWGTNGYYICTYWIGPTTSNLTLSGPLPYVNAFQGQVLDICIANFSNILTNPAVNVFVGGKGQIAYI